MDTDRRHLRMQMKSKAFGAALLAGSATLAALGAGAFVLAPLGWPSTEGLVLSSAFVEASGNDSRGATVEYTYEVGGRWFTSDRLSRFRTAGKYDAGSGQWMWDDRRLVDNHPPGSAIEVFYSPGDPSRSVVVAHANMPGVWGAAAVLAVLWGIAGHLWLRARSDDLSEEEVAQAGWKWGDAA
ncbi:MAG: DUF3592 domain-containing protein [Phycisphaerales bacterium]|nr:DUF3592 domain-containing protein [Phycisphaerales bacterium]